MSSRMASAKGEISRSAQSNEHAPKIVELDRNRVEFHYPSGHVETFIQCPHCKAQDKPMFFITKQDLGSHTKAFHGGRSDSKPGV